MKVCHISDWHGKLRILPPSDLYVVTGDMLPNFPLLKFMTSFAFNAKTVTYDPCDPHGGPPPQGHIVDRLIDKKLEANRQEQWCLQRPFRREVGLPDDAPVLVVKGNHDFISLEKWIGGDVWEVTEDPTRTTTVLGMKVGGCRGINYIVGEWDDELSQAEFSQRAQSIPTDIDILLTHSPPGGILDGPIGYHDREGWGSPALASWHNKRLYFGTPLRAHFFGHVHDCPGTKKLAGTLFSNAATSTVVVDI